MGTHYRLERRGPEGWEFNGRYPDKTLEQMEEMAKSLAEQHQCPYRVILVQEDEVRYYEPE